MPGKSQNGGPALQAYADYETQVTGRHLEVGCLLVMVLMPAGVVLDYFVYREQLNYYLALRVASMLIAAMVWAFLKSPASKQFHRSLGLFIALLPVFFICWMIYDAPAEKGGAAGSPYYAGLNLILLSVAFIMRWSVDLSVLASLLTLAMYLAACLTKGPLAPGQQGIFANNIYFLAITSAIVVVGSRLHRSLRIREFTVRYELDARTKELEDAIRKLREAEAQLVQQEKMASLGVMSAGIIHEINNPLNFAGTGLFTLRKKSKHVAPEQQGAYLELLTDVEEGINRVKNIVSDLRMFTHPDTESVDEVEVGEVVTSTLRFLASELTDKVRVEQTLPPGLTVRANKNKLIHVLTNLVQNSLDALRRKSFDGELPTIRIEGRAEPDRVVLVVRDNGPGIAPGNLPRIFDPFFTTKEVGEGMGLGLSICYRLIQEFGGDITVDSQPDHYCQFTLAFPIRKPNGTPA